MNSSVSAPLMFPEASLVRLISIEEICDPKLRVTAYYWRERRKMRLYPAREDIEPRVIAHVMSNMSIIRVVKGGADFEHRFVGETVAQGYRPRLHGRRLSEIAEEAPLLVGRLQACFQRVVDSKKPLGVHAQVGHDHPEVTFTELEAILLPLGETDDSVDHIMTVSAFGLRS